MADYFHGLDGLGGIHESHPHFSPEETWKDLFLSARAGEDTGVEGVEEVKETEKLFTPVKEPAWDAILRLLRENEKDTITIVAIGPLTNLAIAAAKDPETFLRVKEVVVMGGTLEEPGNVGLISFLFYLAWLMGIFLSFLKGCCFAVFRRFANLRI